MDQSRLSTSSDSHSRDQDTQSNDRIQVYQNATVHTASNDGVISNGTLVTHAGRIIWVGKSSELDLNTQGSQEAYRSIAEMIGRDPQTLSFDLFDCENEHICPGYIDAHVHMGLYPEGFVGEPKDLNELTHPLTPQLRAIDGIWPQDIAFEKARRGGVTTVCILPGSANVIGGAGVVLKTWGIDVEEMCVREPACLKIAFGYNVKHNHGKKGRMPLTRMAIAEMMRTAFDEALLYEEQKLVNPNTRLDRGKEILLSAMRREIPVRAHASRSDDILTALRIAREYGLKLVIEHGYEAIRILDQVKRAGASVMYGPAFRTCGHSEDLNFDFSHAKILLEHGICTAHMTDHPIVPIQYLSLQAGLCVREGLDPDEALKLITIYPAQILGCEDKIGALRVGMDADFLRLNGPPLEVATRVMKTYIAGQVVT